MNELTCNEEGIIDMKNKIKIAFAKFFVKKMVHKDHIA